MSKKYFHRHAGAKFFMPDGKEICFAGGEFDSAMVPDEATRTVVEQELDRVANVPAAMIFTRTLVPDLGETSAREEVRAEAVSSFDTVNKIPAGTHTVTMAMPKDPQPTLSGSLAAKAEEARRAVAGAAGAKKG